MPATTGSEQRIEAVRLEEPVTGTLAQVPVISGPEADRWLAGLIVSPEASGAPEFDSLCSNALFPQTANRLVQRKAQPFALTVHDRCSTFGWKESEYEERVTRALAVKRHWGVDREWEKGALIPGNFHLSATYSDPATVQLAAGANVSPSDGLGLLDEEIGKNAAVIGRGMIWCTPFVATKWKGAGLLNYETIDDDSGVGRRMTILSPAGNYVIIGGGFEGRGPDDAVPASHASQWAYATDLVAVVASTPETFPKTFLEATTQEKNQVIFRQTQFFAILWAAMLHAAVKIATSTATVV